MQEEEIITELKSTAKILQESEKRIREIGINFLTKQKITIQEPREVEDERTPTNVRAKQGKAIKHF